MDTLAIATDARRLAHDSLRGRFTDSEEAENAARYIAARCEELGLIPAAGAYLHPVPIIRTAATPETTLRVAGRVFRAPNDLRPDRGAAAAMGPFSGRAVFVGTDRSVRAGLSTVSLAGKTAISAGLLSAAAKDTIEGHGALGLVQLVGPRAFRDLTRRMGPSRYVLSGAIPSSFYPSLPSIIAGDAVSNALLTGSPVTAEDFETPRELGLAVDYVPVLHEEEVSAHNVACILAGTGQQTIVLGAHYDHLGIGTPDSDGDSIYNGYADNAVGVGMLLAMAAALRDDPVGHHILFLFFTGEELGLLGADAYVHAPLVPLSETSAVIVLDAGAPPAPPTSWELAATSELGTKASDVAAEYGWKARVTAARPNSDYYPFAQLGVQAMLIIPGTDPYEGLTRAESKALFDRWDRYHQPSDAWKPGYPLSGLQRYAAFALAIVRRLDGRQ